MAEQRMSKGEPRSGEIKLVALDLDGTLIRRDKTIGERTLKALREAHRRGIKIVLNSGRMTPSMEGTADLVGIDVYLISYNGAVASGLRSENRVRLFEQPMRVDVAQALVALARERHLHLNLYFDDCVHCEDHLDLRRFLDLYVERTGAPFKRVESLDAYSDRASTKALFILEPEDREALHAELFPYFAARATVVRSEPEYLEFLHPAVDKGAGMAGLCERLGVRLAEVLAVGDSDNDEALIRAVGWGVGVANAKASVRAVAHAMTENDCDHDAVAEALERWVL